MADSEKLRSLHEELTEQQKKLEELQQRYGSQEAAPGSHEAHSTLRDVIAVTQRTIQTLIEVLGEAGL